MVLELAIEFVRMVRGKSYQSHLLPQGHLQDQTQGHDKTSNIFIVCC